MKLRKVISLIITAVMVLSLFSVFASANGSADRFTDIESEKWYYPYVNRAVEEGLMVGTSNRYFSPNAPLTRGSLAVILWKMSDMPEPVGEGYFADITEPDAWYYSAFNYCFEAGIISGVPGKGDDSATLYAFPENSVTRGEIVTILYKYITRDIDVSWLGFDENILLRFHDRDKVADWVKRYAEFCVSADLISGALVAEGGYSHLKLNLGSVTTRAEICTFLSALEDKNYFAEEHLHVFNTVTRYIAPSCVVHGSQTVICSECGESREVDLLPVDHIFSVIVEKPSSCIKNGSRTEECLLCGMRRTVNLPKSAHNYIYNSSVVRNHTHAGYDLYKCKNCGASQIRNYKDSIPRTKGYDANGDGRLTIDEYLGAYDNVEYLNNHANEFLGTRYESITSTYDPYRVTIPGGQFNCTGFVASVMIRCGGDMNMISSGGKGWFGNGYNWLNTFRSKGIFYYWFSSIQEAYDSGVIKRGDMFFIYTSPTICHMGFFWNDDPSDRKIWHSLPAYSDGSRTYYGNNINRLVNAYPTEYIMVLPMQRYY